MKKFWFCTASLLLCHSSFSYAAGLSWGDPQVTAGELKVSGAIRTRYQHKDFADDANEAKNDDWKLADIKLVVNYENPNWLAQSDVRCYQYDRLCDAVFLHSAWAAYKINDQQKLSAGLQSTDFGFGRFWGSSYYETLFNTLGYEDVHNLGLKYQFQPKDYQITLGFYPTDGGNFKGTSKDSSRYSGNFVEADDLDHGTFLKEKNMWVGRLSKTLKWGQADLISSEIGGSFWYSDVKNKKTHVTGHKQSWNIFTTTQYQNWQLMLLAGQQRINNKDQLMPESSTIGAFDYAYNIANDGDYAMAELNYRLQDRYGLTGIKPYLSYSQFFKQQQGYLDSNRIIAGLAFNYKQLGVQAEYIWARNDAMIAGSSKALAEGDNQDWNKLLYVAIAYYF